MFAHPCGGWNLGLALFLLVSCQGVIVDPSPPPVVDVVRLAPALSLDDAASAVRFSIDKWNDAAGASRTTVTGQFTRFALLGLEGFDDADTMIRPGQAVVVDLASVTTALPLRDDRIRDVYFETERFSTATLRLTRVEPLAEDPSRLSVSARLEMHGQALSYDDLILSVNRAQDTVTVTTVTPLLVDARDFGLGLSALLRLCAHPGMDTAARVDVKLVVRAGRRD
jgi:polyisoprenoid-binding protein YceI